MLETATRSFRCSCMKGNDMDIHSQYKRYKPCGLAQVEWVCLVAGIALVLIVVIGQLGGQNADKINKTAEGIADPAQLLNNPMLAGGGSTSGGSQAGSDPSGADGGTGDSTAGSGDTAGSSDTGNSGGSDSTGGSGGGGWGGGWGGHGRRW